MPKVAIDDGAHILEMGCVDGDEKFARATQLIFAMECLDCEVVSVLIM